MCQSMYNSDFLCEAIILLALSILFEPCFFAGHLNLLWYSFIKNIKYPVSNLIIYICSSFMQRQSYENVQGPTERPWNVEITKCDYFSILYRSSFLLADDLARWIRTNDNNLRKPQFLTLVPDMIVRFCWHKSCSTSRSSSTACIRFVRNDALAIYICSM